MTEPLRYSVSERGWIIELSKQVIDVLLNYRQLTYNAKESVGQLYSRDLTRPVVIVDLATRLEPKRAWRGRVKFDREKALAEREALFNEGWHCVGIWHTHPEIVPTPSFEDRTLARDYALAAKPQADGIVFVIVGTCAPIEGLRVWVDDGQELYVAVVA